MSDEARPEDPAATALRSRQFELLVRSVTDYAIFILGPDGTIRSWNPGAERLKGYTEAEIVGRSFRAFYLPEDADAGVPERLLEAARREGHVEAEGWRVRKDGTRFWANMVLTALHDDDGRVVGFAKITRDLSERKAAMDAIEERNQQLQQLNEELTAQAEEVSMQAEELATQRDTLQTQAEELRAADKLKDQFLGILSHELRTPLNAVLGFASILEEGVAGPLSERQQAYAGKIIAGTEVLLGLINDLLDMSRMQAGKFTLVVAPLDLGAVVRTTVANASALAEQKALRLEVDVAPDLPVVEGDEQRLAQVVLNLVGNATKFTPNGGAVAVRAARRDGHVRVEVRDDGPGIDPRHHDRLFQPFFQADSSNTRQAGGTGLGLSIARALVEAHGGRIGVESAPGAGSTFWFELPTGPG